jgi:hypothetical protein
MVDIPTKKQFLEEMKVMAKEKCCLCGGKIEGYGNNAQPLKEGSCCDECNKVKVIPHRMMSMIESDKNVVEVLVYNIEKDTTELRTFRNETVFEAWFNNNDSEMEYSIIDVRFSK